jgi:type II secretory pathway pseudopilin PulG
VVAIIAILAAIAVPNFMEAQVRSKISRVKSDMRSLATAIESYTVDYNRGPIGWAEGCQLKALGAGPNWYCPDATWRETPKSGSSGPLASVTTPVAYISSVPRDPFTDAGPNYPYVYESILVLKSGGTDYYLPNGWNPAYVNNSLGAAFKWYIPSLGPAMGPTGSNGLSYYQVSGCYNNNARYPLVALSGSQYGYGPDEVNSIYDTTNGTRSVGWLLRTNKGIFPKAGQ